MTNIPALRYFKMSEDISDLRYETHHAACFDIAANEDVVVNPGETAVIGTGLKFDIPEGFALYLYPRSSTGIKRHLEFPHSVGIIDADYVWEVKIGVTNHGQSIQHVTRGDRLAQAEMRLAPQVELIELLNEPGVKQSSRTGGIGSTGQ